MKAYMCILICGNGSYYTGNAKNPELRLQEHQPRKESNFTRKHLPVKQAYFEEFERIDEAFEREKQIQKWSHAKKEALINRDFQKLKQLNKDGSTSSPIER
ncbi:GIY-YIG nuclease family protein [Algoriphagus sp. AGSA1]|uniref:GIY-YIG nuclease family protein n=1 Tax=Algoriphagus sp. AGSA1 TaxID=2907213 RepID=UPI001F1F21E1|nr:GIY-YIG nuclease family protein [Algoriphagus sp. AGSA1]MCE7055365.1 GIY-YIG nuclease family protein [Algoriphagus sp. AGSA1]